MLISQNENETKKRIFLAAAKLIADKGYYNVSVREICEASNITKPVLYYYFKDKETLMKELINETHRIGRTFMKEKLSLDYSLEKNFKAIVEIYSQFFKEYHPFIQFNANIIVSSFPESIKEYKKKLIEKDKKDFTNFIGKLLKKENINLKQNDLNHLIYSFFGGLFMIIGENWDKGPENQKKFEKKLKSYLNFWLKSFLNNKIERL